MPIPPPDSELPARHPEHDPQPVDLSRRKLGMGLGVSAIFTLASRPVLAGQCMSPSSAASGNLSTHGTPPTCNGLTPPQWVALVVPPNTPDKVFPGGNDKFHDVFASGSSADWGQTRLYEVMGGGGGGGGMLGSPRAAAATATGPNPISAEFAATLLNIRDSRVPDIVLNETKLIGMWNEWLTTGGYAPMAGAAWNYDQIVTYLRSLQGA